MFIYERMINCGRLKKWNYTTLLKHEQSINMHKTCINITDMVSKKLHRGIASAFAMQQTSDLVVNNSQLFSSQFYWLSVQLIRSRLAQCLSDADSHGSVVGQNCRLQPNDLGWLRSHIWQVASYQLRHLHSPPSGLSPSSTLAQVHSHVSKCSKRRKARITKHFEASVCLLLASVPIGQSRSIGQ